MNTAMQAIETVKNIFSNEGCDVLVEDYDEFVTVICSSYNNAFVNIQRVIDILSKIMSQTSRLGVRINLSYIEVDEIQVSIEKHVG